MTEMERLVKKGRKHLAVICPAYEAGDGYCPGDGIGGCERKHGELDEAFLAAILPDVLTPSRSLIGPRDGTASGDEALVADAIEAEYAARLREILRGENDQA